MKSFTQLRSNSSTTFLQSLKRLSLVGLFAGNEANAQIQGTKRIVLVLSLLFVFSTVRSQFHTPTIDAALGTNEYGTGNANNYNTGSSTWYLTWNNTDLFVYLQNANQGEPVTIYLDVDPSIPVNGGTNANGTLVGLNYDNYSTRPNLPFRADIAIYCHSGYREIFRRDGSNGWTSLGGTSNGLTGTANDYISDANGHYSSNDNGNGNGGDDRREFRISWSRLLGSINSGNRPASFNWMGYVSYNNGMYAQVPVENYNGNSVTGNSNGIIRYFTVTSTADGSATAPFSRNSFTQPLTATNNSFGAISSWDFTMNSTSHQISRLNSGGDWTIGGTLVVGAGTLFFGSGGSNYGTSTVANVNVVGGTLNMDQTNKSLNVSGNIISTGTINLSGTFGGDIRLQGNLTDNGTFNANNRAIFFEGSNVQDIQGSGVFDVAYVRINKSGGRVILLSNLTCQGPNGGNAMEISGTSSILDLNNFTLNLGQAGIASTYNSAISPAGFIRSSPASSINIFGTGALGTLLFDQTTPGTTNEIKNLTIDRTSTGTATLGNSLNITGGLTANNEGTLTVTNGVLNTGGFLTIKSNEFGTARIAANTSGGTYISGYVTVERFIPANSSRAWRLLGGNTFDQTINQNWQEGQAGVTATNTTGFGTMITAKSSLFASDAAAITAGFDRRTPGSSILVYDQSAGNLVEINSTKVNINTYPGYFLYIRGDRSQDYISSSTAPTVDFTLRSKGTVYQGNQTVNIAGTTIGNANGSNLVSNPFASAIDIRTFMATKSLGAISQSIKVWDPKIAGTFGLGGYQTFDLNGTDYQVTPGGGSYPFNNGLNAVYNNVESGAAFFVQNSGGTAGTVSIAEGAKVTGSRNVQRPAGTLATLVSLKTTLFAVINNLSVVADGNLVRFDESFDNGIDVEDVRKMSNFGENFGITRFDKNLVVERRKLPVDNDTIFFNMSRLKATGYQIKINSENFPLNLAAFLEDTYTKAVTLVSPEAGLEYNFTVDANAGSSAVNRFRVVFKDLGSGPLPVTFININAAANGTNIAVQWKVGSQLNLSGYQIEKSTDGRNFTKVGTQAVTTGSTETVYNWLDVAAVKGTNFYRIKAIDVSSAFKNSGIVKVVLGKSGAGISVSPNPVKGNMVNLQFTNQQAGLYNIRLLNTLGQVVNSFSTKHAGGSSFESFTISSPVFSGVYQLEIIAPDKTKQVQKLIIDTGK